MTGGVDPGQCFFPVRWFLAFFPRMHHFNQKFSIWVLEPRLFPEANFLLTAKRQKSTF